MLTKGERLSLRNRFGFINEFMAAARALRHAHQTPGRKVALAFFCFALYKRARFYSVRLRVYCEYYRGLTL